MDDMDSGDLLLPFESLPDPRDHNIVHPLDNTTLIALMAVICGAGPRASVETT